MNFFSKRQLVWIGLIVAVAILGYLFNSYLEEWHQISTGEDLVFFSGLDFFFYFVLAACAIVLTYYTPASRIKKTAAVLSLFALIAIYEITYDIISLKFIDLVGGESSYSVCLKVRKGPKGGFGNNYVLVRNTTSCDKFADFRKRHFTNRELALFVSQLKAESY